MTEMIPIAILGMLANPQPTIVPLQEPPERPTVKAHVTRVVDGDTIDVVAMLPFGASIQLMLRVEGIDCPEDKGLTKKAGEAATKFTKDWVNAYPYVIIQDNVNDWSFNRRVSRVCPPGGGLCLDQALRAAGHVAKNERLGR